MKICIDCNMEFEERIGKNTYMQCKACRDKYKMTDEAVCPYCFNAQEETEDDFEGIIQNGAVIINMCDVCGERFTVEQHVTVKYLTYKSKEAEE